MKYHVLGLIKIAMPPDAEFVRARRRANATAMFCGWVPHIRNTVTGGGRAAAWKHWLEVSRKEHSGFLEILRSVGLLQECWTMNRHTAFSYFILAVPVDIFAQNVLSAVRIFPSWSVRHVSCHSTKGITVSAVCLKHMILFWLTPMIPN